MNQINEPSNVENPQIQIFGTKVRGNLVKEKDKNKISKSTKYLI
jgi:hypothetical protein